MNQPPPTGKRIVSKTKYSITPFARRCQRSALLTCSLMMVVLGRIDTFAAQRHHPKPVKSQPATHTAEERDVAEALFRYLLPKAREDWKGIQVVFLSQDGKDPDVQLLRRFANSPLPVKVASASGTGQRLKVIDKVTKQEGVLLSVGHMHWSSVNEVKVGGGYAHDGKGAMGTTFRLTRHGNRWRVQQFGPEHRA